MSENINEKLDDIKELLRSINDNLNELNKNSIEEDEYEYNLL